MDLVLRAILEIIAAAVRLIPRWREKRVDQIEGEWKHNRQAIDRELGPVAWWVRDDKKSDDEHNRGS